ncbi:MAG: hypothetical protein QNJ31_03570 [Candidatus Caenarcaniphilales bacterium]|nr:hypothetical protein [Candidatus Caenarcaniphilales bacterium]
MAKIAITGAGSAQANGVINCFLKNGEDTILGFGADIYDLMLCKAHSKHLIPYASAPEYKDRFLEVLRKEKPDMLHFQHDQELSIALKFQKEIEDIGIRMLVPDYSTIDSCVHKYKSWEKFKSAGIKVPENIIIKNENDLKYAFQKLGNEDGKVWLRSMKIGGGGKGSLSTNDLDTASQWINGVSGWGEFTAAELLTPKSITWLSIWYNGELVVAQTRKRHEWAHKALSQSGITGVTKVGETCLDEKVDEIAISSVQAVSKIPHGVYGVDMTYDMKGIPNPTEINISRFFTTIQFFAEAGLNMPVILRDLCLYKKFPKLLKKINPLPDGLLWVRGMDCTPRLTTIHEIKEEIIGAERYL